MIGYAWLVLAFRHYARSRYCHGPGCNPCDVARETVSLLLRMPR